MNRNNSRCGAGIFVADKAKNGRCRAGVFAADKAKKGRCGAGIFAADKTKKMAAVLLAALVLPGCAGPSTRVLPQRQGGTMQDVPEEIPVVEEVNPYYLQESLGMLSAAPRFAGSRGEDGASRYIQKLLKDYGYTVNRQRFREKTEHEEIIGTNVVAVRPAEDPDADILLICTWHDSAPESPGAGNNASGVSVFLETARILSGLPTDTEVRFVSLSAHEKDALGAGIYAKGLSKRERERLIGVITFGPCGAVDTEGTVLATQDGEGTMLGDLLSDASDSVMGSRWEYQKRPGMENGVFASYAIPSVQVGQRQDSFDFGTPLDTADTVDAECLSNIVDTVCQAVSGIMSVDTPSMRAKAHYENNWNTFLYSQPPQQRIPFGSSARRLQALLGIPGKLAVVNRDSKNRPIERYRFSMKWFGMEQPFSASYYFTDESLDLVSLMPQDETMTAGEVRTQITACYGEPAKKTTGPYGTDYLWKDRKTGQQIELIPGKEQFEVEIRSDTPDPVLLASYSADGTLTDGNTSVEEEQGYLTKLCSLLFQPESAGLPRAELLYETDGAGNNAVHAKKLSQPEKIKKKPEHSTAGTQPQQETQQEAGWQVQIDPADLPSDGVGFTDRSASLKELLKTYGQILKETDPQAYADGYGELAPACAFEDAFALYVLVDIPPESTGEYQECVRYFDQFGELDTYRSAVRNYLGLQTEE